jgi:hypothetical protein
MKYLIRVTRSYYAGTIGAQKYQYIDSDGVPTNIKSWQYVRPFASRAEAMAYIAGLDDADYLLGHGECARPVYRAVPESKWPESINA